MPIYEYRCPNGHQFELFQKMSDAPAEAARLAARARSRRCCSRWLSITRAPASTRPTTAVVRKGASKDGDGGGSGEKSDSSEKKETTNEGLRLGRQEGRGRGLSPAHSFRSPMAQPGA